MLTWSSLRLLAGIWCDVVIRFPLVVGVGWLRRRGWISDTGR